MLWPITNLIWFARSYRTYFYLKLNITFLLWLWERRILELRSLGPGSLLLFAIATVLPVPPRDASVRQLRRTGLPSGGLGTGIGAISSTTSLHSDITATVAPTENNYNYL